MPQNKKLVAGQQVPVVQFAFLCVLANVDILMLVFESSKLPFKLATVSRYASRKESNALFPPKIGHEVKGIDADVLVHNNCLNVKFPCKVLYQQPSVTPSSRAIHVNNSEPFQFLVGAKVCFARLHDPITN